jgi:hypothetical protein
MFAEYSPDIIDQQALPDIIRNADHRITGQLGFQGREEVIIQIGIFAGGDPDG